MSVAALCNRLQSLDRRIIYLALVAVLSIPFVVDYSLPIYPATDTRLMYDTIRAIAEDPAERRKTVLLISNWGPGTVGENGPQCQVLLRHLLRQRLKFMYVCTSDDPLFVESIEDRLEAAMADERRYARAQRMPPPSWTYGEDFLNLGLRPAQTFAAIVKPLVTDPLTFARVDYRRKLALTAQNFPLLQGFGGLADTSLVLVISAGDEARDVCGIVQRRAPQLKVATATMGVVATELYPYVKSGQLSGLLNSARAAAEYTTLIDPASPATTPPANSMGLGKSFLILMVLLGNAAYLIGRRGGGDARRASAAAAAGAARALSRTFLTRLFVGFAIVYLIVTGFELYRDMATQTIPRPRAADSTSQRDGRLWQFERVDPETLRAEALRASRLDNEPLTAARAATRARAAFARAVEARVGEFVAALLTLGILSFLLGDNRFYRVTEHLMVGSIMAYWLLEKWDKALKPLWFDPIVEGLVSAEHRRNLLWLLLLLPGCLWYFAYSRRYRWLNQVIIAIFIGLAIGPEFGKQIGLIVPQVLDTIRPVWPFVPGEQPNTTVFSPARVEHLIFVIVMVLSLLYFVFFLKPRGPVGGGVQRAGRLAMMIGFGAMFGNTVNTRMSWLAPRIGFLIDDWLGKLFAA